MNGTLERIRQLEAKVERQSGDIGGLRHAVEALNVRVTELAPRVVDRVARISV